MTSRCGDANTKTQNIRECKITAPPQRGDAKQQSATDRSATKKHRIAATRNKNKAANKKNTKKYTKKYIPSHPNSNTKQTPNQNAIAMQRQQKKTSHCCDAKSRNAIMSANRKSHRIATTQRPKMQHT